MLTILKGAVLIAGERLKEADAKELIMDLRPLGSGRFQVAFLEGRYRGVRTVEE